MRDWVHLITAPNQVLAEMWRDLLIQNGIPAMLQPADTASYYGVSGQPVRVMVAKEKIDDAQAMLAAWEDDGIEDTPGPGSSNPTTRDAGHDGR